MLEPDFGSQFQRRVDDAIENFIAERSQEYPNNGLGYKSAIFHGHWAAGRYVVTVGLIPPGASIPPLEYNSAQCLATAGFRAWVLVLNAFGEIGEVLPGEVRKDFYYRGPAADVGSWVKIDAVVYRELMADGFDGSLAVHEIVRQ